MIADAVKDVEAVAMLCTGPRLPSRLPSASSTHPGASEAIGLPAGLKSSAVLPGVPLLSVTTMLVSVTLPVLVTRYVQVTVEPDRHRGHVLSVPLVFLTIVSAGAAPK